MALSQCTVSLIPLGSQESLLEKSKHILVQLGMKQCCEKHTVPEEHNLLKSTVVTAVLPLGSLIHGCHVGEGC